MLSFLGITSRRVLTIVTYEQGTLVWAVPNHVPKSFATMALNIPCTSCGRNNGVEGAAGLAVLSHGVVLVVDGAGRAGAELDAGLRPTKELVYVFDRRPCTSVQLCKHIQIMWSYQHIPYNQVYPEFLGSNYRENVP